jgi:site-specific recombinase XerD
MFQQIFRSKKFIARHEMLPFCEERRRYLTQRTKEGTGLATQRYIANYLLWVVLAFRKELNRGSKVSADQIHREGQRWFEQSGGTRAEKRQRIRQFVREVTAWLKLLDRFEDDSEAPTRSSRLLDSFKTYMEERGLSSITIKNRLWHVQKFLVWYFSKRTRLRLIKVADVDSFIKRQAGRYKSRYSMATLVCELRSFFRFAETLRLCRPGIANAIEGPRIYRDERIPDGPSWVDVRRLLKSTETNEPKDVRDRAILMLLSVYGFRVGEVAGLRLDDIDWENDRITISRTKRRKKQTYPLSKEVGEAILRYLKAARPESMLREVFLTYWPPYRPISRTALHSVANLRMKKLKIECRHLGPHSLRHACATRLMARGCSLHQVGDHLGHDSANSTRVYAKVNINQLRVVADFSFGKVL